jgi:transposase
MIRQRVLHSRVIGTDETGVKINGKKHWFWIWQNKRATFIATSTNRGTTTINENMSGISQEAVLVHDCWKAHFQTPVKEHQLCTAHLEREIKYLEERYKVAWPFRFRAMLKVKQKISGQFKILSAAENFAILRSIIDTAIKNNQKVLQALNVIADYKRN